MKPHIVLLSLIMPLASNCTFETYLSSPRKTIPTFHHTRNIDVFRTFNRETPTKPYVVVATLEQYGLTEESRDEIISGLESQAIDMSLDGVIVKQIKKVPGRGIGAAILESILLTAIGGEVDYDMESYEDISKADAEGIVYVENINYLDLLCKKQQFLKPSGDTLLTVSFGLDELSINSVGDQSIYWHHRKHSMNRLLLEENENWRFRWRNDTTLIRTADGERVTAFFHDGLPMEIKRVRQSTSFVEKSNISLIYNINRILVSKIVRESGQIAMIETYLYDDMGRLSRKEIELPAENEKYYIEYQYFSNEDLPNFIDVIEPTIITLDSSWSSN